MHGMPKKQNHDFLKRHNRTPINTKSSFKMLINTNIHITNNIALTLMRDWAVLWAESGLSVHQLPAPQTLLTAIQRSP